MTTCVKISVAAIIIALVGLSVAWASEPHEGGIALRFEVKSTAVGPLSPEQARDPHVFGPWRPTYAAGISWEGPTRYLNIVGSGPGVGGFIHFAMNREGLSTAQKEFLEATDSLLNSHRQGSPPQWHTPEGGVDNPRQLLLYAVTLQDAKAMAQAYYQYAMNGFRRQIDTLDRLIGQTTGKITDEEKRISEIDELTETTQKSLAELQKLVPYRTDSEAHEAIGELDRMLNAAQVESAGIKAKIAVIQGYQQEQRGGTNAEAATRLNMMFIEESIALQGVEARRQMATRLRELANRFLDLKSTLANAAIEKETLTEDLKRNRMNLTVMKDQLKSARTDEPRIPDDVPIYPVEWAAEYRMGEPNN